MEVTINGQIANITLERERTVGELLAGIEHWLEEGGRSLSGVVIDGKQIAAKDVEAACAQDIDEVERVDISASTWTELLREALVTTLRTISDILARKNKRVQIEDTWNNSPAASFLAGRENTFFSEAQKAIGSGDEGELTRVAEVISERISEIDSPRDELTALKKLIDPIAERLEALPLDLQTGKDASAALTLKDFSAFAAKLLRLIPILREDGFEFVDIMDEDGKSTNFQEYMEEVGAALKELVAAYETGDAILVGDLAEYEIAPRLRALKPGLEKALEPM